MALGRTLLMTWLLAMLSLNTSATVSEITAVIGENVTIPFPCSDTTVEIVWQNNEKIVNHYHTSPSVNTSEPDDSYKHRSLLQLDFKKKTCSLILLGVNELDKDFSCFTFDTSDSMLNFKFHLTHSIRSKADGPPPQSYITETVSVGIAVILVAGLILGILLMRRRRRIQRMEIHLDSKVKVPIIERSPV